MRIGTWHGVTIGLLAAACGSGCRPGGDAGDDPAAVAAQPPVVVTEVQRIRLDRSAVFPGVVEAWEDRLLSAVRPGRVERIDVREGEWVEQGRRIASIDEAVLTAQKNLAEARFRLADREWRRTLQLHEDEVVSPEALDRAEVDRDMARAQLDAARAQYDHGLVTAPVAGYIDRLPVDEGEYVNPGDPVVRLVDDRRLKVVVSLPEREVHVVREGDAAVVTPTVAPGAWAGRIAHVATAADPDARTFRVTIVLDPDPVAGASDHGEAERTPHAIDRLRPGTIVRVRLPLGSLPDVVAVPLHVLVERGAVAGIMLYDRGKAVWRPVRLGLRSGPWIQVESGLAPGELLIVEGHRELVEGDAVRVVDTASWDEIRAAEPAG